MIKLCIKLSNYSKLHHPYMELFFTLLFLDKKKQKSRLASSATSHCTLQDTGRTHLTALTASGLPLHFAELVSASGSSGLPGVTPLYEQENRNMIYANYL
ncbi:MAG: hypothetical protein LBQ60_00210 [Bacteroidales bacterium]|jgi:hypothetical protein|nr:hypothetical protein [Bacteroidales bacterium]